MARYKYPERIKTGAVEAYRYGATAEEAGALSVNAYGWDGPTPRPKTVLRWAKLAGIPPLKTGPLPPGGEYPEEIRKEAIEAYRSGATGVEAARKACEAVQWTGPVPRLFTVLKWIKAAGIHVHNEYPETVKLQAIEAYKAGASLSQAGVISRDRTGWGATPSYQTVFRWVRDAGIKRGKGSGTKRKSKFPENVRLEAVQAYMQGASARKAGEIACKNIGWSGRVPSYQTVINWVRAANGQVRSERKL